MTSNAGFGCGSSTSQRRKASGRPLALALLFLGAAFGEAGGAICLGQETTPLWSLAPPRRPDLPAVRWTDWAINPIDVFVLEKLEARGWTPSHRASPAILRRRLTLDLTGLPPSLEELEEKHWGAAESDYETLVDRLLASPRFGERMAVPWLDAARYADTHGFLVDAHRDMWRWRDWVIDAWNRDLPFDQFTLEQLAGDLLPNPTREQWIATGFNRNHMINYENGAEPDEYRAEYVADRANTTANVWLGLTFQCARCHDHKYDPISLREYYAWTAFFDQVPEQGLDGSVGNATPFLSAPTRLQEERLEKLDVAAAGLQSELASRRAAALERQATWETDLLRDRATVSEPRDAIWQVTLDSPTELVLGADQRPLPVELRGKLINAPGKRGSAALCDSTVSWQWNQANWPGSRQGFTWSAWVWPTTQEDTDLLVLVDEREQPRVSIEFREQFPQVRFVVGSGEKPLICQSQAKLKTFQWQHLAVRWDGIANGRLQWFRNGLPTAVEQTEGSTGVGIPSVGQWRLARGGELPGFRGLLDDLRLFARGLNDAELVRLADADPLQAILAIPRERRSAEQQAELADAYLRRTDPEYASRSARWEALDRERAEFRRTFPTTMIMRDAAEARPTFVLQQGKYDRPGEQLEADTPGCLPRFSTEFPRNRLGLARWLVQPDHPLTARVAVNRLWQTFFGRGLVATPEDFGSRSVPPSHPELLDWLAVEFRESGWNGKHLVRLIVTSETYRQSSRLEERHATQDPENIWLSRAPRLRLEGEAVRDMMLATSGLLDLRLGGPSVFPYQPSGLWEEVSFNPVDFSAQVYVPSRGADLYRRGLYTFWKRTLPPPALTVFDAPSRETCVLARGRTNSPLQALVLMNDLTSVEAARHLAQRGLREATPANPQRVAAHLLRLVVGRDATPGEIQELVALHDRQRARMLADREASFRLLSQGDSPRDERLETVDHAAWTVVASVLLSLDETLTRN